MNTSKITLGKSVPRILLSTLAIIAIGSVFAQTTQPSSHTSLASTKGTKLAPEIAFTTAQAPDEPGQKDDELVKLLREENKRLKAKVERLEKENAELKAKLAGKQ